MKNSNDLMIKIDDIFGGDVIYERKLLDSFKEHVVWGVARDKVCRVDIYRDYDYELKMVAKHNNIYIDGLSINLKYDDLDYDCLGKVTIYLDSLYQKIDSIWPSGNHTPELKLGDVGPPFIHYVSLCRFQSANAFVGDIVAGVNRSLDRFK